MKRITVFAYCLLFANWVFASMNTAVEQEVVCREVVVISGDTFLCDTVNQAPVKMRLFGIAAFSLSTPAGADARNFLQGILMQQQRNQGILVLPVYGKDHQGTLWTSISYTTRSNCDEDGGCALCLVEHHVAEGMVGIGLARPSLNKKF